MATGELNAAADPVDRMHFVHQLHVIYCLAGIRIVCGKICPGWFFRLKERHLHLIPVRISMLVKSFLLPSFSFSFSLHSFH